VFALVALSWGEVSKRRGVLVVVSFVPGLVLFFVWVYVRLFQTMAFVVCAAWLGLIGRALTLLLVVLKAVWVVICAVVGVCDVVVCDCFFALGLGLCWLFPVGSFVLGWVVCLVGLCFWGLAWHCWVSPG